MDQKSIKYRKVGGYSNITMYQASNDILTIPYEITRVKDRLGTLLILECQHTKPCRKETYNMAEIKTILQTAF